MSSIAQKRIANAVHHTVKSNRALLSIPNGWLVIAVGGGITFFVYRRKKCQRVFCVMIVYNFVPVIKTHFVSAQVLVFYNKVYRSALWFKRRMCIRMHVRPLPTYVASRSSLEFAEFLVL